MQIYMYNCVLGAYLMYAFLSVSVHACTQCWHNVCYFCLIVQDGQLDGISWSCVLEVSSNALYKTNTGNTSLSVCTVSLC